MSFLGRTRSQDVTSHTVVFTPFFWDVFVQDNVIVDVTMLEECFGGWVG